MGLDEVGAGVGASVEVGTGVVAGVRVGAGVSICIESVEV